MILAIVLILCTNLSILNGFNVDTVNIVKLSGESGSMFGYSSTLHTNNEGSWVIVGAPRDNMTSAPELKRPGNVYKCKLFQQSEECEAITIRTNEDTRPVNYYGYEEDNQFLGGSIVRTSQNITVCAQLWKNLDDILDLEKPVGRCHDITYDLQTVETNKKITYPNYYVGGYSYAMALIGTVAVPSDVDGQVLLGGPGIQGHRGGFLKYNAQATTNFYETYDASTEPSLFASLIEGTNMGYAVDVGKFGPASACSNSPIVAGMPHYSNAEGHLGAFIVLCTTGGNSIVILKQYTGNKVGSGFGMSVCTADVNNDGIHDVLVGAPLQTVTNYDEGTVFVYYGTQDSQYFAGSVQNIYGNNEASGRFGTSIINMGDLNKDNYNDIAIGAPYEDEGAGAVYIFNGNAGQLNSVFSQRLAAKTLFPGIKSFGTYISYPLDVDGNSYTDFAVGAYDSDSVFVIRSSPVINLSGRISTSPTPIPLSSRGLACAGSDNENPCVSVSVCFNYSGDSVPANTMVSYVLNADTLLTNQGKTRRVDLYKGTTNHQGTYNSDPVTVQLGGESCDVVFARVTDTNRDFFAEITTALVFGGTFRLTEVSTVGSVKPVLNNQQSTNMEGQGVFQTGCVGVCNPDLKVEIEKETASIVYGSTNEFDVIITVSNAGDVSFGTRTSISVPTENAQFLSSSPLLERGSVPVTCEGAVVNNRSVVHCDHSSGLFQQQQGIVRLRYNVSAAALSNNIKNYMNLSTFVNFTATTTGVGNEVTLSDNTASTSQDITFTANIEISGVSVPEQVRASESKNQVRAFMHSYAVFNKGPSPLFNGKVFYLVLAVTDDAKIMVPANTYQVVSKNSNAQCSIVLVPGVISKLKSQSATPSNVAAYVPKRVECAGMTDPKCIIIECVVGILEPTEQSLVDISFSIAEESIDIDSTPEFQFYTTATIYPVVSDLPNSLQANSTGMTVSYIYPNTINEEAESVNLWVIVGSVIGALVVFLALGLLLWKCGFFKRDKKEQLEKWKRQSNYRKTQLMNKMKSGPPRDDTVNLSTNSD